MWLLISVILVQKARSWQSEVISTVPRVKLLLFRSTEGVSNLSMRVRPVIHFPPTTTVGAQIRLRLELQPKVKANDWNIGSTVDSVWLQPTT